MAKTNPILIVAVIGALLIVTGNLDLSSFTGATGGGVDGTPQQPGATLTGNPQFSLPILDSAGTVLTGTVHLLNAAGQEVTSATGSVPNPTALNSNETYTGEVVPGVSTTFYPTTVSLQAPAAGSKTVVLNVKSIQNTHPTVTCYKSDDVTANTASAAEALSANDNKTVRCRIRTAASTSDNNFFSDGVLPPRVVCDVNAISFSQITMREGTTQMTPASAPSGHSIIDVNRTSTVAFDMATKSLASSTDYDLYITLRTGALDPVTIGDSIAEGDNNASLWCQVYDGYRQKYNLTNTYGEFYRNPNNLADLGSPNWAFQYFYS